MASILIVDDSRTSRKILKGLLEEEGYTVVGEAKDGEEGYNKYVEFKPDIVTMDITMPILDGIGALEKIKSEYPDAVVVMVTAAGQKTKMIEAVKHGAAEFISKPFESETLKKVISSVLR